MKLKNAWHSLSGLWHKIAEFFEHGDLVPFAIIISVYHYYKALGDTGEGLVAIPVAIFIDLLHFRTVRHAVRTRSFSGVLFGLVTTAMAVYYHYGFYSIAIGNSVEAMMHALPLPVGIAILAWLNETASVGKRVASLIKKLKANATSLQESESKLQDATRAVQDATSQLQEIREQLQVVERERQTAENKRRELQAQQDARQAGEMNFNRFAWDVMEMVRTGNGRAVDIAEAHGKSEAVVSRFKKSLNGGREL